MWKKSTYPNGQIDLFEKYYLSKIGLFDIKTMRKQNKTKQI